MLQKILSVPKQTGYENTELEVICENTNAIALYEKLGFKKYGTFPHNMKYADAYWMMKQL